MARAYFSSGPDPRLDYPAGYGYGEALVRLSQLLRQGIGDYQSTQAQDAAEQDRQQAYLLRLQQMLGQQEDRATLRQQQQAAAAAALAGRTGRLKILQSLGGGTAIPEGMTPDEAGQPDIFKELMDAYEKAQPKPRTKPGTIAPGHGVLNEAGGYDVPVPAAEPKPATIAPGYGVRNAEGGYDVPVPKEAKPFFEGKSPTELQIIVSDPATSPEQRKLAKEALNAINANLLERAQNQGAIAANTAAMRAMGPQPSTAEERQRSAEAERTISLATKALETFQRHPEWVGGPFGMRGTGNALRLRLGQAPEGFADFKAQVEEMTGTYARRVAGAALTPTEERRYLSYLPDVTKDSSQEFAAKLAAMPTRSKELENAIERQRLGTGATTPGRTAPAPASAPTGVRIPVRRKSDGQPGTILEQDFNPDLYERR